MYFKKELHGKMMTRKIGSGILNEIKDLELDNMEPDYMRLKGIKRGHGTSSNLKVMVKSHKMLFDMVNIVRENFMSLGLICFHNHSSILIHDQINKSEHYS